MATKPEDSFTKKLNELVKEFNDLKLGQLKARGDDFGVHDFFLELNVRGLDNHHFKLIQLFVEKYDASVGISPIKGNDCICIRIDETQFDLEY